MAAAYQKGFWPLGAPTRQQDEGPFRSAAPCMPGNNRGRSFRQRTPTPSDHEQTSRRADRLQCSLKLSDGFRITHKLLSATRPSWVTSSKLHKCLIQHRNKQTVQKQTRAQAWRPITVYIPHPLLNRACRRHMSSGFGIRNRVGDAAFVC